MSRDLCEDLVAGIFERLPAKSLVRFRCLSKSWYYRIGSPCFRRRHYLRSSQKVLIRQWEASLPHFRIKDLDYHDRYKVKDSYGLFPLENTGTPTNQFPFHLSKLVNSCNGIFCLFDYHEKRITLWNPSVRRTLTLPDHPSFRNHGRELDVAVGLGFDPITDDYKIVRISYVKYEGIVENSFVYSMKTGTWSSIASPVIPFEYLRLQTCFVNGALHWVAEVSSQVIDHYILTFNLTSHVFGKIMLPKPSCLTRKPTIINGCLAVVSCEMGGNCWIWVMKDYGNLASWYVHFYIKSDRDDHVKSVMQLSTEGYFLINSCRQGLQVYNPVTGVRSALSETRFTKVYMHTCLDSLELLDIGEIHS